MSTEAPPRKSVSQPDPRLRAALLSGLVFPGAGQLRYGRYGRGLTFACGAGLALLALLRRVVSEILASLPEDPSRLEIGEIFQLAHDVQARAFAALWGWLGLLVAIWLLSVWDAYRSR